MRDFSWTYFTLTGDVDAFMLYREWDQYKEKIGADADSLPEDEDYESCCTE